MGSYRFAFFSPTLQCSQPDKSSDGKDTITVKLGGSAELAKVILGRVNVISKMDMKQASIFFNRSTLHLPSYLCIKVMFILYVL